MGVVSGFTGLEGTARKSDRALAGIMSQSDVDGWKQPPVWY